MLLKRGSNDDNVKKLQEKLGIEVVGNFGPKTEIAVKEWQAKNGLTADGIVGEATWNKIMGITPVVATPSIVTVPVAISPSEFRLDKLKGHIPDAVLVQIPDTAAKFNITNTLRLAHFLAQCGHESGGFRATQENLNYSAKGLKGIFPKYFPGNTADAYARNPQKIANKVYSSRMSNGNEASGDGWKFRGRGYIQLTGRGNYTLFDKQVSEDILANPDLVATDRKSTV
jgi:putative chitinase